MAILWTMVILLNGIYISLVLAYHILPWIFHKTDQTNEKQYQFLC